LVVEGSQALGKFRRYNATTPSHGPAFLFERARGSNTAPLQDTGVNLGEFQMNLLEKIEELTLYALQQEQANSRLREKAASQEARIKALEEMVKTLVERDKGGR